MVRAYHNQHHQQFVVIRNLRTSRLDSILTDCCCSGSDHKHSKWLHTHTHKYIENLVEQN